MWNTFLMLSLQERGSHYRFEVGGISLADRNHVIYTRALQFWREFP